MAPLPSQSLRSKTEGSVFLPQDSKINPTHRLWPFSYTKHISSSITSRHLHAFPWSRPPPPISWISTPRSRSLYLHSPFRAARVVFKKKKKKSQIIPFPCLTQPQGFPLLKVKSQQVTMACRSCIIWRTLASLMLSPSSFPIFSGFQIPGLLFVSKNPICSSSQHLYPASSCVWNAFSLGLFNTASSHFHVLTQRRLI